jgi:signal transduction histidine kinase
MPDDSRSVGRRAGDLMWGSVRARITLTATLVVAATLVGAALALMAAVRHNLVASQDELSKARAIELAQEAAHGRLPALITSVGDNGVAQVVDDAGHVLAASSGLRGDGPIAAPPAVGRPPVFMELDAVPDDNETESYRVWAMTVRSDHGTVTVFAGASPESVGEAVATVKHALWVGIPVIVVLFALATRLLVGRALAPVEEIRNEVAALSSADLSQRLSEPQGNDEIALLARTMNDMLARLEGSARRERQFVADASHELQSPIAAFRAQLEVAQAHPDGVDWPALTRELLEDSDRLERLTKDLLMLAKLDAQRTPSLSMVDLDVVVAEEAARLRPTTSKALDTRRVAPGPVRGDREDLRRLVRNLLDNAVRHASSRVVVSVGGHDGDVELAVADDGPGIAPHDRDRVFERFVRLDAGRSRGSGGSGLGLAIARAVAERHGGTVEIIDGRLDGVVDGKLDGVGVGGGGASFVVRLPMA